MFVRDCLGCINVEGTSPLWAVSFAGQVVLECVSEQAAFLHGFFFQFLPSLPPLVEYDLEV